MRSYVGKRNEPLAIGRFPFAEATSAATLIAAALLCALLLEHYRGIALYSVNIPREDDWDLFTNGLGPGLDLHWLFRQHNEHRIVITRIIAWLLYGVGRWNFTVNHAVNGAMLTGTVLLVVQLLKRAVGRETPWLPWLAPCLLLPAAAGFNLLWAIMSSLYGVLFFTVLAALLLFTPAPSRMRLVAGALSSVTAAYAFGAGIAASAVLAGVFAVWQCSAASSASGPPRALLVERLALVIGIHGVALGAYFIGYAPGAHGYAAVGPDKELFWRYYLELVAAGFGRGTVSLEWSVAVAAFAFAPFAACLTTLRDRDASAWGLVAAWLAAIAIPATVAYGRAGMGALELAKSVRYVELAALIVPLTLGLWGLVLTTFGPRVRLGAWVVVLGFVFVASAGSWAIREMYRDLHAKLAEGAACVERYYSEPSGPATCPTIFPADLRGHLELARELRLSFVRARGAKATPSPFPPNRQGFLDFLRPVTYRSNVRDLALDSL